MDKHVSIVNFNPSSIAVAALGGELSTRQGTTEVIYNKRLEKDSAINVDLIKKVIKSGHTSILEHITMSLLLSDVSVCVEEFFIKHRLASYTVKSRRYVDHSNAGFYVPDFPDVRISEAYCEDMHMLFDTYEKLLAEGIPKEDARFILPYSFHSNFVVTLNLRTLIDILNDMWTASRHMQSIESINNMNDELMSLFNEIKDTLEEKYPEIYEIIEVYLVENMAKTKSMVNTRLIASHPMHYVSRPTVTVVNESSKDAYSFINQFFDRNNYNIIKDGPRELEQLHYQIIASNVSLSCLTHLLRHRMQTIIIDGDTDYNTFVLPDTIRKSDKAVKLYNDAISNHRENIHNMSCMTKNSVDFMNQPAIKQYFALSGNTKNVRMFVNAKELLIMSKLRTCNRAQWEIREIFMPVVHQLRTFHKMFSFYGPSCFVNGHCPEGTKCCGKQLEIYEQFNSPVRDELKRI